MSSQGNGTERGRAAIFCGVGEIGMRLASLRSQLQEILRQRQAAEEAGAAGSYREEQEHGGRRAALERSSREALQAQEQRCAERRQAVAQRSARREAMAERARSSCESRLRQALQREVNDLGDWLRRVKEQMAGGGGGAADASGKSSGRDSELAAELAHLRTTARELAGDLERFAAAHGSRLVPAKKRPEPAGGGTSEQTGQVVRRVSEQLRESRRAAARLKDAFWPELAKGLSVWVLVVLDLLAHGGAVAAIMHLALGPQYLAGAAGSLVLTLVLIYLVSRLARRGAAGAAGRLHAAAGSALESLADLEDRTEMEARIARIMVIDEQVNSQIEAKRRATDEKLAALRRRHQELAGRIAGDRQARTAQLESANAAESKRLKERQAAELAALQAAHAGACQRLKQERDAAIAGLSARWSGLLTEFSGFVREADEGCRNRHPAWADPAWRDPSFPKEFPGEVPLGTVRVDLAQMIDRPEGGEDAPAPAAGQAAGFALPAESRVTLPLALGFPDCGSLLVQTSSAGRNGALATLFNTALRVLVAFPPGKARLTIIDPIGLGQSFAALMHLADHDESLVGTRIWTDTAHIERRLSDLTEHIEKVIQKYLRNRYETIDAYNREAGEMTEAYQFLVVADFPTGFSELALERLASIVNSGPQCGVFTLILHDTAQPLPAILDGARLLRNGPVLKSAGDEGFIVAREDFLHSPFAGEPPPDAALISPLLKALGEQSCQGRRVEVPFAAVVPPDGRFWSASAAEGVRVPIGRAGADRLQYLDLGRGTAQHALIGGRTGSGKSTLFHVIATNVAMWFAPGEVELHLIDFKHGVEFKTYATNGLPHARVIAIESDREFGLSVLNHLNRELNRRGDLFRKQGVQDLASFRKSGAGEKLPRVLLIIDEFQEFFSEDDVVARDAALLLDRFVRQGRAFGVHVVLGSQTLSGMYTLAKSTLGQIGVRIALQCNEADSHLILGEENSAARLLTRPGEAIYNDMSGLVEGNSPFQVVWLPDEVRDGALQQVAARAAEAGWHAPQAPVVFEGNVPAALDRNTDLSELLGRPAGPADGGAQEARSGNLWLGEANAIKGPVEVALVPASGSNLLMIGQHREGALAILCSASISLASRNRPEAIRLIALGADGRDTESAGTLKLLAGALPHGIELPAGREIPHLIEELETLIAANREAGVPPQRRVCLMVFGLQRFPALRHEEDYGLSGGEGEATGERFASVLRDGPEHGVHTLLWCDTLSNLNRSVSRKTLRDFDMRVLFQMSAADSSELIDSAAAGNLGLHNAILALQSEGTGEKFRPYMVPDAAYLEKIGRAIAHRFGLPPAGGAG